MISIFFIRERNEKHKANNTNADRLVRVLDFKADLYMLRRRFLHIEAETRSNNGW